ncbi:hypothetical protein EXS70_04450, partial [Candidatus Peribacteria bacterium]|nr:hypothetical protein [Candidatus Peribacteria bacterium]
MERPLSPGQEQKLRTDLDNFRKNPAKNQEKIERAETALQIHHDLITENTQHAVLRTLSSSQGMTMPNQPRYSIGQFPQQAEATDLQSQLSAMNHASGAAIDMGILHTLQHYK